MIKMNNNDNFKNNLEQEFDQILENVDFDSIIDEEIEALDNIIILNDENGDEVKFEFLDLIEYKNDEYVVLLPTDEDADEVVILKVEDPGNSDLEGYVSVDDEETLQAVFEIFKEKFKDEFNFID